MFHRTPALRRTLFAAGLTCLAAAWSSLAQAQAPARPVRPAPPEEFLLTTKDGVQLAITYYPSNAGLQAVPVVLLHDYNETRAAYEPLARLLQNPPPALLEDLPPGGPMLPRAVVTVDLRGHGGSKTAINADGSLDELDATQFGVGDFEDMVLLDLEAVRAFLLARNDAGQLNLNKLCLVGAGMGANVALAYAAHDWSVPDLAARKQSQDVKALVLLSPTRVFHGLSAAEALKFPPIQQDLAIYLAYGGATARLARECETMIKVWERNHPEPPRADIPALKDFFVFAPQTQMQGTELLTTAEFGLGPRIAEFIELRLGRHDYPHFVRKGQ